MVEDVISTATKESPSPQALFKRVVARFPLNDAKHLAQESRPSER